MLRVAAPCRVCRRRGPSADPKPAPAAAVPEVVDLAGPASIPAAALSDRRAAAAAEAAAAAQRSSDEEEEEEPEEPTAEQLQAGLSKQREADVRERQEVTVPVECRRDWRAAMLWAMGVEEGQDLLNPNYKEVVAAAAPRKVSVPVPGIDPLAIARRVSQQQAEAAGAAAAVAAQQQAASGLFPYLGLQQQLLRGQALSQLQQQLQQHKH
jgi:hypothetical protein